MEKDEQLKKIKEIEQELRQMQKQWIEMYEKVIRLITEREDEDFTDTKNW